MLKTLVQFLPMVVAQTLGRTQMPRIPEPDSVTAGLDHVAQYDQVMTTKLAIAYAVGIEMIYRARPEPFGGKAIDLACGPGHFSMNMARHLKLDELLGVDLSAPMVEVAARNASGLGLMNARFQQGDVTDLNEIPDDSFDLSTFTDAAHHMPDIETVSKVLSEMDRITKPGGLVLVMDLVRLKTKQLTERYVNLLGKDYIDRGLPQFFEDFHNSMYAAWTANELRRAVPDCTNRSWYHLTSAGLPTIQFLVGIDRARPLARRGQVRVVAESGLAGDLRSEFRLMRTSMQWGVKRLVLRGCSTSYSQRERLG